VRIDELIEQLRARVADPEPRADVRPTPLWASFEGFA
jgi:hypothetical protein